jgi:predicted nucleic acid-binding protein
MNEIHRGTSDYPMLGRVVTADWLEVVELQEVAEVIAFARYKSELGGGPDRNNGEAGVLAWAFVNGGTAIIDERAATRIATREGIAVHGTLWLVANAVRSEKLSRPDAERIVDDLADTDMALPVNGSAFFAWAYGEGLLP